jgi:outer membrane protein assembly factor BamC
MAESNVALSEFATQWIDFAQVPGNPLVRRVVPALEKGRNIDDHEQRFRLRLEPGVKTGTSEIKVVHQARDLGDDDSAWPERSSNPAFERAVLAELETYLNQVTSNRGESAVSSLARSGPTVTTLERDGAGNSILYMITDFNRAWAEVGDALAHGDVLVTDFDRSAGVYFVDLNMTRQEKEDPGFLARWFGSDDEQAQEKDENQVQVGLTSASNRVEVSVEASVDKAATGSVAKDLLEKIQQNLNQGPNAGALLLPRKR